MRFAGQAVKMPRFREQRARMQPARYGVGDAEYREGLSITGEGPFPSIDPGLPSTAIPNPMSGIYKQAPRFEERTSIPTRIGTLG